MRLVPLSTAMTAALVAAAAGAPPEPVTADGGTGPATRTDSGIGDVVRVDVLTFWEGKELVAAYWEHLRRHEPTGYWSTVAGLGIARGVRLAPTGHLDVTELDLDAYALGFDWRYYGDEPWGGYGFAGGSLVFCEGSGESEEGRILEYRFVGVGTALLGLGYQLVITHLSLDASVSLRFPTTGYFFQRDGGDDGIGALGGTGFVLAGGVGVGF